MKLKTKKFKFSSCLIFCAIVSLFNLGFASWLLNPLNQAKVELEMQTGDVFDLSSIFSVNENFNSIQFSKYGFINDGKIENTTFIRTTLEITNLVEANEYVASLRTLNELNVIFYLEENSSVDFIKKFNCELQLTSSNESLALTFENSLSEKKCQSKVKIKNITNDVDSFSLEIQYQFSKNVADFATEVYPILLNQNISFGFRIGVDYE